MGDFHLSRTGHSVGEEGAEGGRRANSANFIRWIIRPYDMGANFIRWIIRPYDIMA